MVHRLCFILELLLLFDDNSSSSGGGGGGLNIKFESTTDRHRNVRSMN